MTNPNRVRSLIGAFAQGNATQFNRADGAGYEFVADRILALDPANPQVASRMTTAFKSWRVLESRPPRPRAGGVAADRRGAKAVARRQRHRAAGARGILRLQNSARRQPRSQRVETTLAIRDGVLKTPQCKFLLRR